MSATTKKPTGRKPRTKKEAAESDSPVQDTNPTQEATKTVPDVPNAAKQEAQIEIQNWSNEAKKLDHDDFGEEAATEPKLKSVLDFDRGEVAKLESKPVSDLSVPDLLKVLIRRGEDQKSPNPIVSGGCERLLKQISRERMNNKPNQHFDKDNGYRFHRERDGHRDNYRGGFRGAYRGRGDQKHFSRNPRNQDVPAQPDS